MQAGYGPVVITCLVRPPGPAHTGPSGGRGLSSIVQGEESRWTVIAESAVAEDVAADEHVEAVRPEVGIKRANDRGYAEEPRQGKRNLDVVDGAVYRFPR